MNVTYRVLATVSRGWVDWRVVTDALLVIPLLSRPVLVHGDCPDGDRGVAAIAQRLGWETEAHPAIWRPNGIYNPQAGLLRNRKMVELGADRCLAFIKNGSRGATHCAGLAEEAGIPTVRYTA